MIRLVRSRSRCLLLLLEPFVRNLLGALAAAALNLDRLRLVRLQVVGEVRLFW
jgi:hypothetical protein